MLGKSTVGNRPDHQWIKKNVISTTRRLTVSLLFGYILLQILIIIAYILYIPGVIIAIIMYWQYRNKYITNSNKQVDSTRTLNAYINIGQYSWLYVWYRICMWYRNPNSRPHEN